MKKSEAINYLKEYLEKRLLPDFDPQSVCEVIFQKLETIGMKPPEKIVNEWEDE